MPVSHSLSTGTRRSGAFQAIRKGPAQDWKGRLQSLPTRVKLAAVVTALVGGGAWWAFSRHQQAQVPSELFAYNLTPFQLQECSQWLSQKGVLHQPNAEGTNLKVAPEQRLALLNQLSLQGLPHADTTPASSGPLPPSRREALLREQIQLQQTLAASLRSMQGVEDATVQLAIPQEAAFQENNRPTASVMLKLRPGYQMSRTQCSGIARFVAGAVPDLQTQDVTVVDHSGQERPHQAGAEGIESLQFEVQQQVDVYLASKAQRLLDQVYGRGNALVQVNAELDFSQFEVKHKDVGAPGQSDTVVVSQKTDEFYENKKPSGSLDDDEVASSSPEGKKYEKVVEAVRRNPDESFTFRVFKLPRLSRLTCSVVIQSASQKENALQMVRGSIGLDANRGDEISVSVVPLHRDSAGLKDIGPITAPPSQPQGGDPFALIGLAGLFVAGVGVWTLGQRRIRLNQPHLDRPAMMSTQTQCDLNHPSSGRSPEPTATQPRVLEKLEQMARQSPRETASMLRSYMDTNTMN